MHLRATLLATAILASTLPTNAQTAPNTLTKQEAAQGWRLLFDGKTTEGWHSTHGPDFPATGWEVKDGLLSVTEHGGDFRITPGANSGIKYFVDPNYAPGHDGHGSAIGFEYQVLDDALHPDAKKGRDGNRTVASLYDMIPPGKDKPVKPVGEWNTARIVVRGTHGEHWLNGVKVLEYDRATPQFRQVVAESKFHVYPHFGEANEGYILLQDHGFPVSFRNIKIRELPPTPPQ